ncbi:ABC transporter permease [Collinsella sp. AGMB00827]|uniref:ABC transporter permease n=1 Tax=Collinsella ureilytica TaxID=2869515 RepID=A0ABS7MJZ1_9ACTN|nr:ABC transporter permease [Collinsella urealyticum]MBY4797685.1 ABC transporter permease [Collinsella urealyticum]
MMSKHDHTAQLEMIRAERRANSPWAKLRRNKMAVVGLAIVASMVAMALLAPLLAPADPNQVDMSKTFLAPGTVGHPLGTDAYGRDLLSRIIFGARISIFVAVGGTVLGAVVGVLLGLAAGFFGGILDTLIMRVMDGMMAFPFILLALILMTILGQGTVNVIIAIGVANVPYFARVVRGQVRIVKNEEYCSAERVLGASPARILFAHILPNAISPIIVYFTLNVAGAIISEAALSFLGMGIQPPTASWGNILAGGRTSLRTSPHIATVSGLVILVTVLGCNLLGDGIRDVFDPKQKR